jgi:NAD+ diphosphatase
MQHGEDVTFGTSRLDRAAALRGRPEELAALQKTGRVLAVWRGKPLVRSDGGGLGWLPADHKALARAPASVFLGREADGQASFAADLSAWEPESGSGAEQSFIDQSRQIHPDIGVACAFEDLRAVMTTLSARDAELAATSRALLHWHRTHGFCAACGARSDLAQAGWQRTCPSCGAQHFPRTDPVVIMLITHGNRVLLGRNTVWPEGMYSLLAGFIEPGETVEAAVRREVQEESGVRVGPVRYLTSQPWPFPANLMLGCRGEALSDAITLDPAELEDALWLTREDLLQVFAGRHPKVRAPRNGAIASFLLRNWLADRLD